MAVTDLERRKDRGLNRWSKGGVYGSETTLYDTVMLDT